MEDIYIDFTNVVADGRGLPIERVREIAKGRVWTGEQAKDIGLVDELGGIMKAIVFRVSSPGGSATASDLCAAQIKPGVTAPPPIERAAGFDLAF